MEGTRYIFNLWALTWALCLIQQESYILKSHMETQSNLLLNHAFFVLHGDEVCKNFTCHKGRWLSVWLSVCLQHSLKCFCLYLGAPFRTSPLISAVTNCHSSFISGTGDIALSRACLYHLSEQSFH